MRTPRLCAMAILVLALGTANASASSVDVIWHGTGTGTTTVAAGATGIVGDIVLSIGVGDTPIGDPGVGAIQLSADSSGTVLMMGSTQILISGWLDHGATSATTNPHSSNVILMGDILQQGPVIAAGTSIIIGTITVDAGAGGGSAVVGPTSVGDAIFGGNYVDIVDEFSFGGGIVNVPEPTTASLLGLGLIGLSLAHRNRKD